MTEPSKHSGGRRKATKGSTPAPEAGHVASKHADAPPAKPIGGARIKQPEPENPRGNPRRSGRADSSRTGGASAFTWLRTTAGAVTIGAVVILVAVVLRFAVGGSDDDKKPGAQKPVGPALTSYGADWKTKDGSSYRLTVTPIVELVSSASDSHCVPAATNGFTNLRFTVRVDNLGSAPAPVPELAFAATVKDSGALSNSLSFAKGSHRIDLGEPSARDCATASTISPAGQDKIAPQSADVFNGMIAGVRTPVGPGLALLVRYSHADASSKTGSSDAQVLVQYPDMRSLS